MHYGDKEQLEKQKLIIIVYKHETNELNKEKVDCHVTSVQDMKYFPINLFKKIITEPNKYLKKYLINQKEEGFYKLNISSTDGYDQFQINSIKNVTYTKKDIHRLH
jgi:hypothetical protein